jgi:hypothetical protein
MSVNFTDEDSAVPVTQPSRNRHEIDPGHDAHRTKVVSQIVEADPFQAR